MAPLAVQSSVFTTTEEHLSLMIFNPSVTTTNKNNNNNNNDDDSNSSIIIEEDSLGPYDVLCGRNRMALHYVGNRRFRITISMNLKAYDECTSRTEKSVLIATIVQYLQDEAGARFLKPLTNGGGGYVELNEKQAREKVGHSLRDMSSAIRRKENRSRSRSRSPSPTPSLPPRSTNSPVPRVVSSSSITTTTTTTTTSESKQQEQEQYDFEPIPI